MFTKHVSLAALCVAAAVALLSSRAFGGGIELKLSFEGQEFPVGEKIPATVALVNGSEESVTTVLLLSEVDGKSFLSFEVLNTTDKGGGQLPYCGPLMQMSFEGTPVYEIPAGGRVGDTRYLTDLYHLYQPGEYEVRAVYRQLEPVFLKRYKKPNALPEVMRSEPVRITITDKNRTFQHTVEMPYEEKDKDGNPREGVTRLTLRVYRTSKGNRVFCEQSHPPESDRHQDDGIRAWGTILDGTWPSFAMERRPYGQRESVLNIMLREEEGSCCIYQFQPDGRRENWYMQPVPADLEKGAGLVQWEDGQVETMME